MTGLAARVPEPKRFAETIKIVDQTMGELIAEARGFPSIISLEMARASFVDTELAVATAWECCLQDVEPDTGAVAILAYHCLAIQEDQHQKGFMGRLVQSILKKRRVR